MHYAGLDITSYFPTGMRFSPGYTTLIGTTGNDEMRIERSFVNLVGGRGEDEFHGTNDGKTESFYGGLDNDRFNHSEGFNIYHGGQSYTPYQQDGLDTMVLDGVGTTFLRKNPDHIEHLLPQYLMRTSGQENWLFSIERFEWRDSTDKIFLGPGLELLEDGLTLDLNGQQGNNANDGKGDVVSFEDIGGAVLINASQADALFVQTADAGAGDGGLWIEEAEWVIGGTGDDKIYLSQGMRGAEGGGGDDIIDGRLIDGSGGTGPEGSPAELRGGSGDDMLVASYGQSIAYGGTGSDTFVLSTLTGEAEAIGSVEFTIHDADANDRLLAPINLFNNSGDGFDGSELMPVLGAIGTYDDLVNEEETLFFEWRLESTLVYSTDLTVGEIPFFGSISYEMDETDLLIRFQKGEAIEIVTGDPEDGGTATFDVISNDPATEAVVRVVDFDEGDLGLVFHDPGDPVLVGFDARGALFSYPNRDAAVAAMTNNGTLLDALDVRPDAPASNPNLNRPTSGDVEILVGSAGNDVIIATSSTSDISGGDGNDDITGTDGADILNGGEGTDTLSGGGGDDTYEVNTSADTIIENASSGRDSVFASSDFTLPDETEDLTLLDGAITATGNELNNRLTGNAGDNVLIGHDGNDTLYGDAGNDTLIGGAGDDRYVHAAGTGDDVIEDTGGASDNDRLIITGNLAPTDITFHRSAAAADNLILLTTAGDRLTIIDYFGTMSAGSDVIIFDDGTTWDRAAIDAQVANLQPATNEAPIAVNDPELLINAPTVTVSADALLANDRDGDGDPLTITSVANPSVGSVSLNSNGDVSITVPSGFMDLMTFDYTISDGQGGTATATVSIGLVDIGTGSTAVVALADNGLEVADTGTLQLDPAVLFSNDQTDDPNSLSLAAVSDAQYGTVAIDANGQIIFTPTQGYDGLASFRYTVQDGTGATSTATVTLTVHAVNAITGTSSNDTISGTTNWDFIDAGDGNDVVTGNNGADEIVGGSGSDTIDGGSGQDVIDGGSGNDEIHGGGAFDLIFGGNNGDILWGDAGNDTLSGGSGSDVLYGGTGTDYLYGDNSGDTIYGGEGTDWAYGGDGADVIVGEAGRDHLFGEASNDTISGGDGNDDITGGGGYDAITGDDGNDRIWGDGGNDTLVGNAGSDEIHGGTGSDVISGGSGDDILNGGSGADTFVFTFGDGNDVITDFEVSTSGGSSTDELDLQAFGFASFNDVTAIASQVGNDLVLQLDTDVTVTLTATDLNTFTFDDVIL